MVGVSALAYLIWRGDMKNLWQSDRNEDQKRNGVILEAETGLPIGEQIFTNPVYPDENTFHREYTGNVVMPTRDTINMASSREVQARMAELQFDARYHQAYEMRPSVEKTQTEVFSRHDTGLFPPEGEREMNEALADVPSTLSGAGVLNEKILDQKISWQVQE